MARVCCCAATLLVLAGHSAAFLTPHSSHYRPTTTVFALTERQMQFWEDVEDGLKDIEKFYKEQKDMDIDRIQQFALRYDRLTD